MGLICKPTVEEIKTILDNHSHWLREDCEGWEKMRANLSNADLSNANLSNANLRCANLSNADLEYADLSNANLRCADLSNANLSNADLSNANLRCADLSGVKNINHPIACPSDGEFTAWKKLNNGAIAKLLIPEDARRFSATGRKCRCDKAIVLAIYDKSGKEIDRETSNRTPAFVYKVGETVVPDSFDENRWNECSNGIHFFITRQEAEDYE